MQKLAPSSLEDFVDMITGDLPDIFDRGVAGGTLTFRHREILRVDRMAYFSANFRDPARPNPVAGEARIMCYGTPTPSSSVTHAVLHLAEVKNLRAPFWDQAQSRILLWLDRAQLPLILEQMRHAERYVWIGQFEGGHTYGDLHTFG